MPWSTSQLAELAGTTIKAVRHYHEIGLLDEPERKTNGYKQYQVAHFLRLLQITRLSALGVPLAQITSLGHADTDPDEAIRVLDTELDVTVTRLQRIRGELALILRHRAPPEMPPGFSEVAGGLSEAARSMVMIYSRVLDESTMDDLRKMIIHEPLSDADKAFQALAPDVDRGSRRRLGELLAPEIRRQLEQYPSLRRPGSQLSRGTSSAESAVQAAIRELYNPAQLEVVYRAHLISTGAIDDLDALETALDSLEAESAD
ncbi:MerR family transcriptional regulator [Subtercola boreus]|uniref:MerR family transcriptional regulator n=1 Tax=Subtercola boreus TaxID=120213 RepID=A0A3E0VBC8_9MICO|nr:MerR family transcriptional regulator [Subtercola boreus]RFA07134.1 MerR family transcriptional regulator [Subtercola boreus]